MKVGFDGGIKLEFHDIPTLLSQSIYSRLTDYEDVNNAKLLSVDVFRHSRYVTFQMAEVAIDKRLFAKILSQIKRFRCYSV